MEKFPNGIKSLEQGSAQCSEIQGYHCWAISAFTAAALWHSPHLGQTTRNAREWRNHSELGGLKPCQECTCRAVGTRVGNGLTLSALSTSANKSWVLMLYCVLNNILSMQNPTWICFSCYTQMQRWGQLPTTQHPVLSHWEPSHKAGMAAKFRKWEIHRLPSLCSHRPFHAWQGIWQTSLLAQL